MDSRTIKALEFGKVLEHLAGLCVSEAGRRVSLGLFPLRDADAVNAAHTLFDEVRTWSAHSGFRLSDFPDLEGLFPHLEKAAVSPSSAPLDADALWALRETLLQGRKAAQSINENGAMWPSLRDLVASMPLPEMTLSALSRCLGDDGLIKDESSPELMLVRGELRRLHLMCLRKVKDFAVQYNIAQYLQDDYMTLASDRYVLPLKSNFKGRIQGIIHDYSNTGETCYFEPLFLVEQNNRLQELRRQEREEERKVLRLLTDLLVQELDSVETAWNFLIEVDINFAKCALADAMNGRCAPLDPGAPLCLRDARHPLLALEAARDEAAGKGLRRHVVPVDILFRPGDRALIISGGNAGGKTVTLKTLGLIVLMTLCGLPVPVGPGSSLPLWRRVHAFIGDEQSLDDHLSTFTAQIRHLGNAWEATDRRTLILLDEFGAGTDPAQGAALAQAVLDGLLERGAHVVAATHFPALKTYALTREGVRAASVLFDPGTKKPLFRLAYDQVGASQALDVAREHGLPESVLRRAEQYLLLDGQDMTAVMDRLNALAAKREGELDALKAEQQRTREKRKAVQERFERERERLIKDVRELSAKVMKDWQEGKAGHKQALKELAKVRAELHVSPEQEEAAAPAFDIAELKPGQHVMHRPWNKKAVVREVDARQNRVKLDMNGVTLWADAALLGPADAPQQQAKPKSGVLVRTTAGSDPEMSLLRLDLRGKRADQALGELSQYLDRALLSGREGVEIVHGRGTGALRKEVHAFLKTFPGIASFALAPEDQGGDGVTIVTFK